MGRHAQQMGWEGAAGYQALEVASVCVQKVVRKGRKGAVVLAALGMISGSGSDLGTVRVYD